ncbi:uncharacterized protein PG998_005795 [Apiospora kogelbergensis]|uniref:uncharacterized protein n=1 Tax=Apiospora kogelbergensis TaxID=1337665 RepID=UPI003130D620
MGARMRPRQVLLTAALVFFVICVMSLSRVSTPTTNVTGKFPVPASHHGSTKSSQQQEPPAPPPEEYDPTPQTPPAGVHPMRHLIDKAEHEFEIQKKAQSKTLEDAVAEYRRRYSIPPPPNFDKWFAFAKARNVQLIDEFDNIHDALTPFWGLKPATIRQRAQEALGFDNQLLGVLVRDGKVSYMQGGGDWQREATAGMMDKFVQWLPSMDLCFNLHDEPRVMVPHDDLSRLVKRAREVNMPAANDRKKPKNSFTKEPKGLSTGTKLEESKLTRFNVFAHQPTWTHSRLSCPPGSPARGLEDEERKDSLSKYALGELGFVYNVTAMSDICNTPSLSSTYGFFDRPNAFNIVHDLFPIFSQSKLSSYSDIIYPSPWYWYGKVTYNEELDRPWREKEDKFYWRGSTTGGFSRNGGWRRQHRQRFVQKVNAADQAKILVNTGFGTTQHWESKLVNRGDYKEIMDIFFSHIGQCDPGDCEAQREFFTIKDRVEQQDAWRYKYLLDIDGNAFSGRFYAFLKSRSMAFKWAIFREWHMDWLKPWVHYIPLSLQGDEWLEAVRYFGDGTTSQKEVEKLTIQKREWANKVLRNEDFEVWFFRLLLEYGRIIDDDRETIGFSTGTTAATVPGGQQPKEAAGKKPTQ